MSQFGIEYATRQCEELLREGAPGLHFYTLNKARSTTAVVQNLALERLASRRSRDGRVNQRVTRLARQSTARTIRRHGDRNVEVPASSGERRPSSS